MPRENRKRGKKHKKQRLEEQSTSDEPDHRKAEEKQSAGPSWIVERNTYEAQESDAPFGYVDPDVKAYFKTVDTKLREWQELDGSQDMDEGGDTNPNEERRLFLVAALQELSGKEQQLATDPECSNVLERMLYSMDDFVKRVFADRLAGSYEKLSMHRFGSHVVQTLLSAAKAPIHRETKGVLPPSPDVKDDEEKGRLPTLTELVINICDELLPSTTSLIMDPFASHVLRALFLLLCLSLPSAADSAHILRSKKSAKHRSKQGPMKSVFASEKDQEDADNAKGKRKAVPVNPEEFEALARRFVKVVREELGANEVRALAADKAACPVLVVLLEMESVQGASNEVGSLMDSVSAGLVSFTLQNPKGKPEPSDYVATLLRDASSSHVLEKLVSLAPEPAFGAMWDLYFSGKLSRLAVHPVANFVVARAIERMNTMQMSSVLEELKGVWPKFVYNARTGVLKALVDRAVRLKDQQEKVVQVIHDAFGVHTSEEQSSLVECTLYLKTHGDLHHALKQASEEQESADDTGRAPALEPTVQGSLLIQSLLQCDPPHNQSVIQSLTRLPAERLLAIAHHPTGSRILDAFLSSPTIPPNARRQLILAFQGHFPTLVDDRIGSRVGERLWATADPYLKEKIARGLMPHENALVGSRYGKFFVRGLNLYLLKRDPEKWKSQQVEINKAGTTKAQPKKEVEKPKTAPETVPAVKAGKKHKRKRKEGSQDKIDALFDSTLGKRQKKGSLADVEEQQKDIVKQTTRSNEDLSSDKELSSIFTAIRNAPKQMELSGKRKKRK